MIKQIYFYSDTDRYEDQIALGKLPKLKIGDTQREQVDTRIKEQRNESCPLVLEKKGSYFAPFGDREFHRHLIKRGYKRVSDDREWFYITVEDAEKELLNYKNGVIKIDKYFESRPHQEWVTSVILDRWESHLASGSNDSMIQPLEACPRFGKLPHSYQLFKESGLPIMLVPSYVLTANSGYEDILESGYDITCDVSFIDTKDTDCVSKVRTTLGKGGRVVLSVSLHDKAEKINNDLLDLLSNYNSFIHVEEADFGTTTELVSERLFKYIYSSNNLVVPSTGTNIARAIRRYDNKTEVPIIVTYLDLLEAKNQNGFLFDSSYVGDGSRERASLENIRENPQMWANRLKSIVTPACYTLQVSDEVVSKLNTLSDTQRPNMSKLFSAKNAHAMKSALCDMFMSETGEDLFSLYFENYGYVANSAAMMFVTGKKNVDAIVDCGNMYASANGLNYLYYAIHGDETSNAKVENLVKKLVGEKKYDRIILVSCGMASRSFTIPEIIITAICSDGGRMEPAVQKSARSWSPSAEMGKTHGLTVKYSFNNECESHVEAYLISSAIDGANGNVTQAARRLHGIVDFLKYNGGVVEKVCNPDELAKLITSPTTLISTARCLSNFDSLLESEEVVSILSRILSSDDTKLGDKWKSAVNKAKTYITKSKADKQEISAEDAQLKDMREKIYSLINKTGNLYYLAPKCDSFESCMYAIANDPDKAYDYRNLVGIDAELVIELFLPHLPTKILNLIVQGEIHHAHKQKFVNFDSPHKSGILKLKF